MHQCYGVGKTQKSRSVAIKRQRSWQKVLQGSIGEFEIEVGLKGEAEKGSRAFCVCIVLATECQERDMVGF